MSEGGGLKEPMKFEQLPELREKTEAVSQFLVSQLKNYLEGLRPLLAPRRVFGDRVRSGLREEVVGAEAAFNQLRDKYKEVCRKPFALSPELDEGVVAEIENRLELYPWEYSQEAKNERETKTVTMTSPVRWVLSYSSGYTLSQIREAVAGRGERRQEDVRQFVVNALMIQSVLAKYPGIAQLLKDLRYEIQLDRCPGLGDLPFVTISACLPSFRPSDDIILAAIRLSGVPAFIELIDISAVDFIEDPLKSRIKEMTG